MNNKLLVPALLLLFMYITPCMAQQDTSYVPLYGNEPVPNTRPGHQVKEMTTGGDGEIRRVSGVTNPAMRVYPADPSKNKGTAVIICPGGGYQILAIDHEGEQVAEKFAENGITAFVLKYRLPNDQAMRNKSICPLQDVQQAVKHVREHAEEYKVEPNKIGVMGFSAGGHLASSAGVHYQDNMLSEKINNLRPDFMLLIYPVISMDTGVTHNGSRVNLLGDTPSAKQIAYFSNEKHVNEHTPPAFLVHAEDDEAVPIANTYRFYEQLQQHQVPSRMLSYPAGGHGFGLNNPTTSEKWFDNVLEWLDESGF